MSNTNAFGSAVSGTVAGTAVTLSTFGLSAGQLSVARIITITPLTAGLMVTWDGTTPTSSVGHLLPAGGTYTIEGKDNINAFKMIREASVSATVTVTVEA